jgi:hypothetical protein
MFRSTLRPWFWSVKPRHRRSVRPIRTRLEALEPRDVPTTFDWWGNSPLNTDWSTPGNWKVDGQLAQTVPDSRSAPS